MAVSFVELAGSPKISAQSTNVTAQRVFRIAWDDWLEFARDLLGGWTVVGDQYVLSNPKKFPGLKYCYVTGVQVEPYADAPDGTTSLSTVETNTNHYDYAKISVNYGVPQSNTGRPDVPSVPSGTYLEYGTTYGAQYMTTPGTVWKWSDGTQVESDVSPGILIPTIQHILSWYQVAVPPWDAIRQSVGLVNSSSFLGASAGTVMFTGAECHRVFNFVRSDIGNYWTVRYTFAEQAKFDGSNGPYGWNYFYKRAAVGGTHWVSIKNASGNKPFGSSSFSGLFAFG